MKLICISSDIAPWIPLEHPPGIPLGKSSTESSLVHLPWIAAVFPLKFLFEDPPGNFPNAPLVKIP